MTKSTVVVGAEPSITYPTGTARSVPKVMRARAALVESSE